MRPSKKTRAFSFLVHLTAVLMIGFLKIAPVFAKSLGVVGETYPIIEEDFLQFIQHRIADMKQNGEWQKIQNKMQQNVVDHVDRPEALTISKAVIKKEWSYDPSIVLSHDLRDGDGRVFAHAGTLFNPLDEISLHSTLVFYDADDKEQVAWVKKFVKMHPEQRIKLILVNGAVSSQVKLFHQKIYFDQMGQLTHRFQITHVPATVTQVGKRLKISEVLI